MSSNATPLVAKTNTPSTGNIASILFTVTGVLTVIIGMGLQFAVLNNGPSGDNMIMSNIQAYGATLATGIVCILIGLVLWKLLNQSSRSFMWLFVITWISYLLSNMAIMFSLYQVQLVKQ
jgi:hypothetical protein